MSERDMYYNSYGYGGYTPMTPNNPMMTTSPMGPNASQGMPMSFPGSTNPMSSNTYANSQFNDMNERISRLERQVKRLDQRLTRLETPYANQNMLHGNEPDNNMYMM